MKLHFVNHSSFIVELNECLWIFDYCTDETEVLKNLDRNSSKRKLFFVSHEHFDHYNPAIFNLIKSDDLIVIDEACLIPDLKHFADIKAEQIIKVKAYEKLTWKDFPILNKFEIAEIFVASSTDIGVSFSILTPDNKIFYHAGDLNAWNWSDEKIPKDGSLVPSETDYIEKIQDHFNYYQEKVKENSAENCPLNLLCACIPCDKRLGNKAFRGVALFIETLLKIEDLGHFHTIAPMHLFGGLNLPAELQNIFPENQYGSKILNCVIPGTYFHLD